MNREEAIQYLFDVGISPEHTMELVEAIEQEPCDDAISREKTMQIVRKWFDRNAVPSDLKNEIEQLPPVTPQQKMGRWINAKVGKMFPSNDYKCSECGNILDFDGVNCGRGDANYCPNCGAKMEVK